MKTRKAERDLIACPRCYTGILKDAKVIAYCQPCQKAMKELNQPTPAAHTPTPLVARHGEKNGESFFEIVGMKAEKADYFVSRSWGTRPEDEANAEFIVRACNNFHQMLDALKYVVELGESYERVQEIAEQAIAKATEEK